VKIRSRALVALATTATLALGLASPAQAERIGRSDARGDVIRVTEQSGELTWDRVSAVTQGDMVRTIVDHRRGAVFYTARYRDLRRYRQDQYHLLRIVTPRITRDVELVVDPANPQGSHPETGATTYAFSNPRGQEFACEGLRTRIDYGADTVWIKVPRSCLRTPSWVRVAAATSRWPHGNDAELFDMAYSNGLGRQFPALSPQVYRD
jgi:hypothetical protein